MARRGAVTQVKTFGGRNSNIIGGPGVTRPVQRTRILGDKFLRSTSVIVIDGAPSSVGWLDFRTQVHEGCACQQVKTKRILGDGDVLGETTRVIIIDEAPGAAVCLEFRTQVPEGFGCQQVKTARALGDGDVLGETTSVIVVDEAPGAPGWLDLRTQVPEGGGFEQTNSDVRQVERCY